MSTSISRLRAVCAVPALVAGFLLLSGLVTTAVVYLPALGAPFFLDDWRAIVAHPGIRMTTLSFEDLFIAGVDVAHRGRFLLGVSFAVDYYVHGLDPAGFHLTNVLLHLVNGGLVFLFVRLTLYTPALRVVYSRPDLIAASASALWLLHPLQTEAVIYVWQRSTELGTLFYLAALCAYAAGRLTSSRPFAGLLFMGCGLAWVGGLLSKEIVATLPFVLYLYEWYFFRDLGRRWLRDSLPWLGGLMLLGGVMAVYYLGLGDGRNLLLRGFSYRDFGLAERVMTEWRVVIRYLSLFVYPHPARLTLEHDVGLSTSLLTPVTTLGSGLALAALFASAVAVARRLRLLSFCLLWWLGNLVIESSVIPLEIMFEHRMYLPSVGLVLLSVATLFGGARIGLVAPVVVVLVIAGLWGWWTYQRNIQWADELVFWQDAVAKAPDASRPLIHLALARERAGQPLRAAALYSRVIGRYRRAEHPSKVLTRNAVAALTNRAAIRMGQGDPDAAWDDLDEALRLNPGFPEALGNRGLLRLARGETRRAIEDFTRVVRIRPSHGLSYLQRGRAHLMLAEADAAVEVPPAERIRAAHLRGAVADFTTYLALDGPDGTQAVYLRALAYHRLGRPERARTDLERCLTLAPDHAEARALYRRLVP